VEAKTFIECKFDLNNNNDAVLWQQIQKLPVTLKKIEELEEENKALKEYKIKDKDEEEANV
jgi:hypothetical protein